MGNRFSTPQDRRGFLKTTGLTLLPALGGIGSISSALGIGQQPEPRLIVRQENPVNLEFPYASLHEFITPSNLFYVRNHFAVPNLQPNTWRLRVQGLVRQPLELRIEEIRRLPARTVTFTMECAGNSRALLNPPGSGVPWQLGAVSTAEWTGIPLSTILDRAGIREGANEVICEGGDQGRVSGNHAPANPIHFARGLPLQVARQNDILLAYRMNGRDLTAHHGFPLRLVVPGWYGMASVKWLSRIILSDRPFAGYFQSIAYTTFAQSHEIPVVSPITEMQVKSLIARPGPGERIPRNQRVTISGAAWAGMAEIRRVEVSTDGGRQWRMADLQGQSQPKCWRLWEYGWQTPAQPGRVTLMARATDSRGRTQPLSHNPDNGGYLIHHILPVQVMVI